MPINTHKIPEILYRGDSDKYGDRQLKIHLKNGLLCTNLISGGIGATIFNTPLVDLVKNHIYPGWGKTHFLSFTESKEKAYEYGVYGFHGQICPFFEDDNNWDFALFKFTTMKLVSVNLGEPGVFNCRYNASFKEFTDGFNIILINTFDYLHANTSFFTHLQIRNAERDKEWLILPTNQILLNNRFFEYSAKIDMSDIIDYELYVVM